MTIPSFDQVESSYGKKEYTRLKLDYQMLSLFEFWIP